MTPLIACFVFLGRVAFKFLLLAWGSANVKKTGDKRKPGIDGTFSAAGVRTSAI